jgi:hypothetical protein
VAQKVVPVADASLNWDLDLPTGRVEIVLRDGRRFARTGYRVPGNAEAPLTWQDLGRKFVDCATVAVPAPAAQHVREALDMARHLEDVGDCAALVGLLG